MHSLNQARREFKGCHRHSCKGSKFYKDLMSDFIVPLAKETEHFIALRQQKRYTLLRNSETDIVKLSFTFADNNTGSNNNNGRNEHKQDVNMRRNNSNSNNQTQ